MFSVSIPDRLVSGRVILIRLWPGKEIFTKLSTQYKAPLRNIIGEAEEAIQTTITHMIHQMIALNNALTMKNTEIIRLQKLCTDNKINFNPPTPPNRAQRRAKLQKKNKKKD